MKQQMQQQAQQAQQAQQMQQQEAAAEGQVPSQPAAPDFAAWGVRQLKAHLAARGVDFSGCIEKAQLVELCRQHG